MAVYGTQGCRRCCRTCAYVAMHDACRICDGVRAVHGEYRTVTAHRAVYGACRTSAYVAIHCACRTSSYAAVYGSQVCQWRCRTCAYVAVHGVYRTATAYMAVYGSQVCRWRMSYELVRGYPRRMSYLRRRTSCPRQISYRHGVRDRLWFTRLPTELSYLRVRGRSRQAAYLHRHTGPFTAHVIPVTAYVTVYGSPGC